MGKLLSVNISEPKLLKWKGAVVSTSIAKEPKDGEIFLAQRGLQGDGQADLINHGRPFQAVYAYPYEHYSFWQKELDRDPFTMGQFGENFTTEGLLEGEVCLGDIYRIGSALVQVTSYRYPCGKLAIRMQKKDFPKLFLESFRSGWYMRILEEGVVKAGDSIDLQEREKDAPSIEQMLRTYITRPVDFDAVRDVLEVQSLADPVRSQFENLLEGMFW